MITSTASKYDVFISFCAKDRSWVNRCLKPRLTEAGVQFIDQDQFSVGSVRLDELERAVRESHYTLLVLSPAYLADTWEQFTNILASSHDLNTRAWRVIPALIDDCEMPMRLQALVTVDLRRDEDWIRLLKTLKPESVPIPPPPECRAWLEKWRKPIGLGALACVLAALIAVALMLIPTDRARLICHTSKSEWGCPGNMQGDPGLQSCTDSITLASPIHGASIVISMTKRLAENVEWGYSLWEVEAYQGDVKGDNLARGGTASASSVEPNTPFFADRAVDGQMTTRWSSVQGSAYPDKEIGPQWLKVALLRPAAVDRIVLKWQVAYAAEYCIEILE